MTTAIKRGQIVRWIDPCSDIEAKARFIVVSDPVGADYDPNGQVDIQFIGSKYDTLICSAGVSELQIDKETP